MGLPADAPENGGPAPDVRWVGPPDGAATHAELRVCPLPMVGADEAALLKFWPHWQANRMPEAGGLLDQPAGFVEAMDRIRRHMDAAEAEEAAKNERG